MDKDHNLRENLLALTLGSALVSLGVIFFNQVGLLTGGTAGLAIFITKITELSFGQVFFALNLPFYILSVTRMGWRFTINTFIAVSIVSFAVDHLYHVIQIAEINKVYAAMLGRRTHRYRHASDIQTQDELRRLQHLGFIPSRTFWHSRR